MNANVRTTSGRVQQLTGRIGLTIRIAYVRTKWERLLAGDTLRIFCVSHAGNCCHFVLMDKDESCPTADLSNRGRPNGPALFDR